MSSPSLPPASLFRLYPQQVSSAPKYNAPGLLPVTADSVHLDRKKSEKAKQKKGFLGQLTDGERWKGGFRMFFQSLRSVKWWLKQGAVACGITLATCWLPGSQLVTIPAWLSMAGALKHGGAFVKGFRMPEAVLEKQKKKAAKEAEIPDRQWSGGQKAQAAMRGAWTFVRDDLKNHWKGHLGASTLITLATCWLPGSQLVLIPSYFCMMGMINAVRGMSKGYKKPGQFLSP